MMYDYQAIKAFFEPLGLLTYSCADRYGHVHTICVYKETGPVRQLTTPDGVPLFISSQGVRRKLTGRKRTVMYTWNFGDRQRAEITPQELAAAIKTMKEKHDETDLEHERDAG